MEYGNKLVNLSSDDGAQSVNESADSLSLEETMVVSAEAENAVGSESPVEETVTEFESIQEEAVSESESMQEETVTEPEASVGKTVTESEVAKEKTVTVEAEQKTQKTEMTEGANAVFDTSPERMEEKFGKIEETEKKLLNEVREMHKLYHNEYAGRLRNMQEELEHYRKFDKGRAYDEILAAVARIYVNYETLADEVEEPKAKKNIKYMLMDIEELLESYGMSRLHNEPGEMRNTRHCQVVKRVPTDDPSQHGVIAKVYNSGFYIENRSVIKELVDIYFYDGKATGESLEKKESADENISTEQEEL